MPGYHTRQQQVRIGGSEFQIRALSDRQQYSDPNGDAGRAGISSANWSLFGQLWPSGFVLAEAMSRFEIAGKRMLEIGCGLGLSSLVLQRRGANITASDHHPLAEAFLQINSRLNNLPTPKYVDLPWDKTLPDIGRFEVIIGSDVLYERNHAELLSALISRHAHPHAECVITDPGRNNSNAFSRSMQNQGFQLSEVRSPFNDGDVPPYRGKLLSYRR